MTYRWTRDSFTTCDLSVFRMAHARGLPPAYGMIRLPAGTRSIPGGVPLGTSGLEQPVEEEGEGDANTSSYPRGEKDCEEVISVHRFAFLSEREAFGGSS